MDNDEITYKMDTNGVDWEEMRATLIEDDFDNGRSVEQYKRSFENTHSVCIAYANGRIIGTARALSDGVCNAYIVDVWTYTPYRKQGIARTMLQKLIGKLPGQHVYLFTDDIPDFYRHIGFKDRGVGLEIMSGQWLVNE